MLALKHGYLPSAFGGRGVALGMGGPRGGGAVFIDGGGPVGGGPQGALLGWYAWEVMGFIGGGALPEMIKKYLR